MGCTSSLSHQQTVIQTPSRRYMERLPDSLLSIVFSFHTWEEHVETLRVCRRFHLVGLVPLASPTIVIVRHDPCRFSTLTNGNKKNRHGTKKQDSSSSSSSSSSSGTTIITTTTDDADFIPLPTSLSMLRPRSLSLLHLHITRPRLQSICNMHTLRHLTINDPSAHTTLVDLTAFSSAPPLLQSLTLEVRCLSHYPALPIFPDATSRSLRHLSLTRLVLGHRDCILPIVRCRGLVSLTLRQTSLTPDALHMLCSTSLSSASSSFLPTPLSVVPMLSQLATLQITHTPGIRDVSELSIFGHSLTSLNLAYCPNIGLHPPPPHGPFQLPTLQNLWELNLKGTGVSDITCVPVHYPNLTAIDLPRGACLGVGWRQTMQVLMQVSPFLWKRISYSFDLPDSSLLDLLILLPRNLMSDEAYQSHHRGQRPSDEWLNANLNFQLHRQNY